jgi:SAM-dependent methyltransferase
MTEMTANLLTREQAIEAAAEVQVSRAYAEQVDLRIGEGDQMFDSRNPFHYLRCGASALNCVTTITNLAGVRSYARILDFGCGHGRVMRWLRVAYPEAAIVGTDVYSPGVEFCAGTFGSTPIVSGADFDNVPTCPTSDLIWVGSVFTHLTESGSRKLLNNVIDWLSPEGLVVFSVHRRAVASRFLDHKLDYPMGASGIGLVRGYYATGYGYSSYQGTPDYGVSLTKPHWWVDRILDRNDIRL